MNIRFKHSSISVAALGLLVLVMGLSPVIAQVSEPEPVVNDPVYQTAAEYSAKNSGDALLVYRNGTLVFEEYQSTYEPEVPHLLASGTKSFGSTVQVVRMWYHSCHGLSNH